MSVFFQNRNMDEGEMLFKLFKEETGYVNWSRWLIIIIIITIISAVIIIIITWFLEAILMPL